MSNSVYAPISIGELIDKITILEIKLTKTHDDTKRSHVTRELMALVDLYDRLHLQNSVIDLKVKLTQINKELWDIEDSKRKCEKSQTFDSAFIDLARNVYLKNDIRAALKKEINLLTNSAIIEEKIYEDV
jgi:hypothetical protein